MAKDAVFQVRMDADVKERVEILYKRLGISFADAVRMLATQSLIEQGLPFKPGVKRSAFGIAAKYANPDLIQYEEGAFERAMIEKHAVD